MAVEPTGSVAVPLDEPVVSAGGTPVNAVLEQRAVRLEEKVDRIEAILTRLEPRITEWALVGAKASDLLKMQLDLAEVKGRLASIPTWWMLMVSLLTTWIAGAGTVFTLVKVGHP